MQKSKFVHLITVLATLLCFVSCEYDTVEFDKVVIPPDQEVSFSDDIIPIFTSNCIQCHDNGGIDPNLSVSKAYDSLIDGNYINTENPGESKLFKKVDSGHGSLNPTEKQLILEWINRGANND